MTAPGRHTRDDRRNGSGDPSDPVRVVLVGRDAAEQTLRKLPNVELIRAREPLDAIAEVAGPIDPSSTAPTLVIVAPGAVPEGRTAAFAAGIRRAAPAARIIALADRASPGFDAAIPSLAGDAADLLATLAGLPIAADRPTIAATPGAEPPRAAHEATATVDSPEFFPEGPSGPDPQPILAAILRGGDPVEEAMRGIRARLGVPNAAFVAAARIAAGNKPPTGGVPVRFADRTLGYLVAPRADHAAAESEAARLAHWVALALQQDQLKKAAFTDELTGAWNRRYFTRFLSAAIEKAREARHSVAVLYFDLDNFKIYNDRYGHAAGDEILVETVKLLRSVIRPSDRVCRIGGDEFAVIFYDPQGPRDPGRGQSPSEIGPIARRFQEQICRHKFPKLGDEAPGTLTISGGMAAFPWDGADVSTLLDRADALALQSKRMGKNTITLGPGAERVCSLDPVDAD